MFFGLFGRPFADTTFDLYGAIVAEARRPAYYTDLGVPDTVTARFDMIVLIMALVQRRLRAAPRPAEGTRIATGARATEPWELARQVLDLFFSEMDGTLREMGIGDPAVPKRITRLAGAWSGRAHAYDAALDAVGEAGDTSALAAALARNVYAGLAERPHAAALAERVVALAAHLDATSIAAVTAGRIGWPDPVPAASRTTP
jgi:cytochrome b pre-mRNA-processing protein 3